MKIIVNAHKCEIDKTPVNEKEINITKCEFEFTEEITDEFVKEAYFTLGKGETYKQIIVDNECDIPGEVLEKKGDVTIGVVAYLVENNTTIKRYNPSPAYFNTWEGSLRDAENSQPITPTDKEQIEQMLNNINVDANKSGKITTITITYKDGTTKDVTLEDGKSIEYNWQGTSLGIRQEGESSYNYVNLKGDKGDPGAIKMIIVNQLPATGEEDTIYLVPIQGEQGNNYEEYIYVNNSWEKLGGIQVEVDLSDYYTKEETNALIPTNLSELNQDSTHRLVTDIEKTIWNGKQNHLYPTNGIITKDYMGQTIIGTDLQLSVLPTASAENVGKIVQYTGTTDANYTTGYFYQCVSDGGTPATYSWDVLITNKKYVDDSISSAVGDINTALDEIQGEVV